MDTQQIEQDGLGMAFRRRADQAQRICYGLSELSGLTGISKEFFRNESRAGRLRMVHVGKRVVIMSEDLSDYMQHHWKRVERRKSAKSA